MTSRGGLRRGARGPRSGRIVSTPRRLLLDTHVWLWWQADDPRLGVEARGLITDAAEVRFSSASAWEIAIKSALGKLKLPRNAAIEPELARDGFEPLPVTIAHAESLRELPALHGDPFDRLLIAQALAEGLAFVTADRALGRYELTVVDATV